MRFRSDLGADIVRFPKSMVSNDGFTLALPCGQSYTSLIKRQASPSTRYIGLSFGDHGEVLG